MSPSSVVADHPARLSGTGVVAERQAGPLEHVDERSAVRAEQPGYDRVRRVFNLGDVRADRPIVALVALVGVLRPPSRLSHYGDGAPPARPSSAPAGWLPLGRQP